MSSLLFDRSSRGEKQIRGNLESLNRAMIDCAVHTATSTRTKVRERFPGYYRPPDESLREMVRSATFILDSSALLNLYRYPKQARDDLLRILATLSGLLWLPHQIGVEFQENRLGVVAEQVARFKDLSDIVTNAELRIKSEFERLQLDRRHSSISPDAFLQKLSALFDQFKSALKELEQAQPDVFHLDELRTQLDEFFLGKAGPPPSGQDALESIYKEGAERYKRKIPPGYLDAAKSDESYSYQGLVLEKQYGNLIIWKQILEYAKDNGIKNVCFVTDDEKEYWWWIVSSKGKKTIGPRPELVHEIYSVAGVDNFYMYNSERFMRFAEQALQIEVTRTSIAQVRDVTQVYSQKQHRKSHVYVEAVRAWIEARFGPAEATRGFPDVVCTDEETGQRLGFEIKVFQHSAIIWQEIQKRASRDLEEAGVESVTVVAVLPNEKEAERCMLFAKRLMRRTGLPSRWSLVVGAFDAGDPPGFTPVGTLGL